MRSCPLLSKASATTFTLLVNSCVKKYYIEREKNANFSTATGWTSISAVDADFLNIDLKVLNPVFVFSIFSLTVAKVHARSFVRGRMALE